MNENRNAGNGGYMIAKNLLYLGVVVMGILGLNEFYHLRGRFDAIEKELKNTNTEMRRLREACQQYNLSNKVMGMPMGEMD